MDIPSKDRPRVVGIGEILWDIFPDRSCFGGAPANFAAHASNLGCDSAMVSSVGSDELGEKALRELATRGIDCSFVARSERPTGTVKVALDDEGKADYVFAADTAWDALKWSPRLESLARETQAVCFGSLGQRAARSCGTIQRFVAGTREDCLRIFDVNLRQNFYNDDVLDDSLFLANVLKLNDEEIDVVDPTGIESPPVERLQNLCRKYNLRLAALTLGAKGALLATPDSFAEATTGRVDVVDTVGAGDAFTATTALGMLRGASLEDIGTRACEIAAFVCSQPGATPELPPTLRTPF